MARGARHNKLTLHLLTHKPADPQHCETRTRAKSRNVKKFSDGHQRDVTKFDELLTFDHAGTQDAWKDVGFGNVVATLDAHDHAT
eukprot:930128-Lingulodinium_polyedra.AAC.1